MRKDKIFCSNCGAQNDWYVDKCKKCHQPLSFPHPIQLEGGDLSCLPCSRCGNRIPILKTEGELICAHCGTQHIIKQGVGYLTIIASPNQKNTAGIKHTEGIGLNSFDQDSSGASSIAEELVCTNCGSINLPGAAQCGQCGVKLEFDCPKCHSKNIIGAIICANCGINIQEEIERQKEEVEVHRETSVVIPEKVEQTKGNKERKNLAGGWVIAICVIGISIFLAFVYPNIRPSDEKRYYATVTALMSTPSQFVGTAIPTKSQFSIEETLVDLPLSNWMPDASLIPTRLSTKSNKDFSNEEYIDAVNYEKISATATAVVQNIQSWGRLDGYYQTYEYDNTDICNSPGLWELITGVDKYQTISGAEQSFATYYQNADSWDVGLGDEAVYSTYGYESNICNNTNIRVVVITFRRYNLVFDIYLNATDDVSEENMRALGLQLARNIDTNLMNTVP